MVNLRRSCPITKSEGAKTFVTGVYVGLVDSPGERETMTTATTTSASENFPHRDLFPCELIDSTYVLGELR